MGVNPSTRFQSCGRNSLQALSSPTVATTTSVNLLNYRSFYTKLVSLILDCGATLHIEGMFQKEKLL